MFRSAVLAAAAAARTWSPGCADSPGPDRCCRLCHMQYRALVLEGPLRDLPHGVAHAAVLAVDGVIAERLRAVEERFDRDPWHVLLSEDDRARALLSRRRSACGGLLLAALDELAEAQAELSELRRCYTEPALAGFLAEIRIDGVPDAWA